ncbi:hypothetical protein SKAU_G00139430 [Synaphobranchus kaupii]|uniref:Uncharacterized protein n=1 Tax=Synaphobranchus kaupii TaxID=118154 RepID=A0A9Q1FSZ0_SYNKA|nr:hypothetical protein SKAU_G00139430 [Synaphobranchus kaupii]
MSVTNRQARKWRDEDMRDFGKVFRKAYEKCMEELHVKKAFKACGIVPLDSHAINSQRVMPAAIVVLPEGTPQQQPLDRTQWCVKPDLHPCQQGYQHKLQHHQLHHCIL